MTNAGNAIVATQLRGDLDGKVISPDDPEYDEARAVFPGGFDRRPAAIVRPQNASEVAQVVSFARDAGLELAIRGGGHSGAGHGVLDDGVVIDLRAMRGLEIEAEGRTAWAHAGLTAGEYSDAAGEHGLATGFGDAGTVGIGGITLGGGVGYLSRLHGLTIDSLLAAEVVTADGQVLEVSAESHPDLFWAIRGGGGNFGVATRFKFRLHEVPSVVGGMLMLPATAEVLSSFLAQTHAAPDEFTAIVNVMPAPPMPFVPAERHGELVAMALVCFAGSADEAEPTLAPLRSLAEPIADTVAPIPYPEIYPPEQEDYHPTVAFHNLFTGDVDGDLAELVLERLASSDASNRVVQLRPLGGAIDRVAADATAYAHRGARTMANIVAFYESPEERPVREAWVDEFAGELRQGNGGAYVNFLAEVSPDRVRAAYPGGTWDRLREIKAAYDPGNLFRSNQNIPPAA